MRASVGRNWFVVLLCLLCTGCEVQCDLDKHTYDTVHEVSKGFSSAIKHTLTILQPTDDIQEGRIIRMSKTGTLNIYIAVDISQSISTENLQGAREGIITLIEKISSFTVSPKYEIIFFSSNVYEIVNILDFIDGNITLASIINNLKQFDTTDKTEGSNLNLAFRTMEERMVIIKHRVGAEAFKEHRHVLVCFTDGFYNMGGNPMPTVDRIKKLVYMDHTDASKEEYLDIYIFGIGVETSDENLQSLTTGTRGRHYFRIKDASILSSTFEEIIDDSEVSGLCGLYKDYETTGDKISKRKRYPWVAFVSVTDAQRQSFLRCFGSLVSPHFVLTAAHCFHLENILPEHVTVEIEDGHGSGVKKVKTFTLHPEFNVKAKVSQGVDEFYDYDVALIQLQEAVNISTVARPICIPCTQETSDALKLSGLSTCAQQEELLLKSRRERLSFLTKMDPLVQEKEVFAKLGDNRNACIKKVLNVRGIRVTDPTVAVTDNFLCTGGLTEHRDHIACGGDGGGAVFKNYDYRTIQIGVVSWGTHLVCRGGGLDYSTEDSRDFHINLFRVVPFLKSILGNDDQDDYAPLRFLRD